ncbi:MAG: peptide MFS transporter [Pseudoxanthomonas sp.]
MQRAATTDPPAGQDEWLGHPRGLAYITVAEAFERFSFYGMQSLLMLYMTGWLLLPEVAGRIWGFAQFRAALEALAGPLPPQALAAQIFGIYVSLVYFSPILGGWLGDRVLGRTQAVLAGGCMLAAGYFLMASAAAFLASIALLVAGTGLLKSNLAAQVGQLYAARDSRRERGYTAYFAAINVGGFLAPLVCGTLGERFDWRYGFVAAGIGMLLGLAVYLRGIGHYREPQLLAAAAVPQRMSARDWLTVAWLLLLIAITACFWTVQTQAWNIYPLWLRDHVDLRVGTGLSIPVTWFQSIDSLAVLLLAPLLMWLWKRLAATGREPQDLSKIASGSALYGLACLVLGLGQWLSPHDGRVAALWPVLFHFVAGLGYLCSAPVALALVSRAAPAAVNAMMAGAYYLGLFLAGFCSGWLGRFYETALQAPAFWALHAAIGGAGTLLLLVLYRPLARRLEPRAADAAL